MLIVGSGEWRSAVIRFWTFWNRDMESPRGGKIAVGLEMLGGGLMERPKDWIIRVECMSEVAIRAIWLTMMSPTLIDCRMLWCLWR